MDTNLASCGSTDYRHPPDLQYYHGPLTLTCPPAAAQTMNIHMNPRFQHGLGQQHRPQVTNTASGGSMDSGELPFFISDILQLLRTRVIMQLGSQNIQGLSLDQLQDAADFLTSILGKKCSPVPL